jgi:predicted flap endonuclease-1-like 5' DNA nuclease
MEASMTAHNETHEGVVMAERTIEQRLTALEDGRRHDDNLIKTAAAQLRKAKDAQTLDDLKHILGIVAGQLDAVGRGN